MWKNRFRVSKAQSRLGQDGHAELFPNHYVEFVVVFCEALRRDEFGCQTISKGKIRKRFAIERLDSNRVVTFLNTIAIR